MYLKNFKLFKQKRDLKLAKRKLLSKKKLKNKRKLEYSEYVLRKTNQTISLVFNESKRTWMPTNLSYLLNCSKSVFHIEKISKPIPNNNGYFKVPAHFSIIDNPKESYNFIKNLLGSLINESYTKIYIDYNDCVKIDLSAQSLLDIILKDVIAYFNYRKRSHLIEASKVVEINGINFNSEEVEKLLHSVGSVAIHSNRHTSYPEIIPYPLCIHSRDQNINKIKLEEQKELDTTKLVDYVLSCLGRLNRKLTTDRIEDLSTVIGEILINAEEHSTTKYRFSIGYFHEFEGEEHYGVFRLTILNFGQTIYEKFKDDNCPNKDVVEKMEKLSKQYTAKKLFKGREFEEESLWTLYALQEGVTSVAPESYKKRGNGSIRFIESFFNIKGKMKEKEEVSRMVILSGNTNITFDGSYNIVDKEIHSDNFKMMTFNDSGNIEDKPDNKFVKHVDQYFPGTIISAKILFNDDDFRSKGQ
ncbi:hypothetical protein EHQ24_01655 [Leptospira noumeaensis]|uniref:Uncharacterized protein n=1 Tax=Leptospira noumeaensis TaxID=2484964 RepID=A0A4R9IIM2_9LEPT|nr:hypothetical protein [Leptospira noumeaensis]TGK87576.1 hypothetical protein EHQ24_01655 [Leptospira noumeaensis]